MSSDEPARIRETRPRANSIVLDGVDLLDSDHDGPVLFARTWKFRIYRDRIGVSCIEEPLAFWDDREAVSLRFREKNRRIPKSIGAKYPRTQAGRTAALEEAHGVLMGYWDTYGRVIRRLAEIEAARWERASAARASRQLQADIDGPARIAAKRRED
ncbi:unnamed protein product [marine sediment metagenome]|uniref:Uncharacterized protein n=1 Tax=marine sediment metagenome TaxID=412755 RepID=X0VPK0_9ZZZZ